MELTTFAHSHYLKKMRKQSKGVFDASWKGFILMLSQFDLLSMRSGVELISQISSDISIHKVAFKILPNESSKTSGRRCIVAKHTKHKRIVILMVYKKGDIGKGKQETAWYLGEIKKNFPELFKE